MTRVRAVLPLLALPAEPGTGRRDRRWAADGAPAAHHAVGEQPYCGRDQVENALWFAKRSSAAATRSTVQRPDGSSVRTRCRIRSPRRFGRGADSPGSLSHILGVRFGKSANLQLTHVGYRGSPPAMQDLIARSVAADFETMGSVLRSIGFKPEG